ncbi:MAG: hypothetical protein RJA36_3813 [Pseudomonadota bacterium]|jgi:subtilisin family serine protease
MPSIPLRSIALAAALASALATTARAQPPVQASDPPVERASTPIPGQYLILFKQEVADPEREGKDIAIQAGGRVLHHYRHAIKGVAIQVSEHAAAALENALRRNPNVESFEQDATVHINEEVNEVTQSPATWGLDRIDHRELPPTLDGQYHYNYTGKEVHAFIIDTGIRSTHTEFTDNRVKTGTTTINDGRGTDDCHGHGTHVAGTVGGSTYGVAKGVNLVPVRVLDCKGSGTWSGVVAGIDWVTQQKKTVPVASAVGNMSLGGGYSSIVNAAVDGAVTAGVTMVVAAGNSNFNACNYSPASAPRAITVGATTSTDARSSYSNHGSCLDLFAPGSSITSAWNTSDSATNTISGTSMASPHVTGVAALALAARGDASPAAVTKFLVDGSTKNVVGSPGPASPNRLLYSLTFGVPPTEPTGRVSDISTSTSMSSKQNWRASATVTITDTSSPPVPLPDISVSGSFSNGGGDKSCVTGTSGTCTMSSSNLSSRSTASTAFTVTGLSGFVHYDSTKNIETSETIYRPQ